MLGIPVRNVLGILSLAQIETGEQGSVNAPHGSGTLGSQSQAASACRCG
ncbi:hypothetical protein [Pleurocapsa sp. PCC 7327]|nr:hypothetical protein [Pleurocapsa sp. PCC 7327]